MPIIFTSFFGKRVSMDLLLFLAITLPGWQSSRILLAFSIYNPCTRHHFSSGSICRLSQTRTDSCTSARCCQNQVPLPDVFITIFLQFIPDRCQINRDSRTTSACCKLLSDKHLLLLTLMSLLAIASYGSKR